MMLLVAGGCWKWSCKVWLVMALAVHYCGWSCNALLAIVLVAGVQWWSWNECLFCAGSVGRRGVFLVCLACIVGDLRVGCG